MSLTTHITAVEIHDGQSLLASIEVVDAHAASITIKSCVNAAMWRPLAAEIQAALVVMKLEGDE